MMPHILERFTAADLPWLTLRQQRGEFSERIVGRVRDADTDAERLDEWRCAPGYAILRADLGDLERLGIEPDEIDPNDEHFAAIEELPFRWSDGKKSHDRQTYAAAIVFFRASNDLQFDFLSASGVLRRELFHKCRETSGGAHMQSCQRFPPAYNELG